MWREGGRRKKGGRREGREMWRGEEGTLHKLSQVSRLHCLHQLLWPRGEVRDNCTQVAMATAEPHTLTLNRTRGTTLLGRGKGERRRRVSGHERYEGVCDIMKERGREINEKNARVKILFPSQVLFL